MATSQATQHKKTHSQGQATSSFEQDTENWQKIADKLLELKFLSPMQRDFIMAALRGFGGGWTEEVLDRAFRAMRRLQLHEKQRQKDVVGYFVTQAQTAFPGLKDKLDMVIRVTRVIASSEIVNQLEVQVYIFYAARDKPELLNHI